MSTEITITGRLGVRPVLASIKHQDEKKWVRFTVATNPYYRNSEGQWVDGATMWFTCKAWGDLAQNICNSLDKGNAVIVQGRLVVSTWESQKNGEPLTKHKEHCIHVTHIGPDLLRGCVREVKYKEVEQRDGVEALDRTGETGQSSLGTYQADTNVYAGSAGINMPPSYPPEYEAVQTSEPVTGRELNVEHNLDTLQQQMGEKEAKEPVGVGVPF